MSFLTLQVAQDAVLLQEVLDATQQLFVDAAGDVREHSFPRHGRLLTAMLPNKLKRGRVF